MIRTALLATLFLVRCFDGGPQQQPVVDAGEPPEDAGTLTHCDVSDLRFEGVYTDSEPTRDTGPLSIHFTAFSTASASGPCAFGDAWPSGWWGQGVRHGRTAIVQSRQNGDAICASVATAAHDILYEGTIASDCASMSGTYVGTMDDGSTHRGTWSASLAP